MSKTFTVDKGKSLHIDCRKWASFSFVDSKQQENDTKKDHIKTQVSTVYCIVYTKWAHRIQHTQNNSKVIQINPIYLSQTSPVGRTKNKNRVLGPQRPFTIPHTHITVQ